MARPRKEMQNRNDTEKALLRALEANGIDEKYFRDQADEYMKYYDNLSGLNAELSENLDIDILKEKRQVTKEMRSILMFLGLKPTVIEGGGGYEEL